MHNEPKIFESMFKIYLLPAATMVTMMDVEVDDDWTRTVTSTPNMSSQTGLERISFSAKSDPAALPV